MKRRRVPCSPASMIKSFNGLHVKGGVLEDEAVLTPLENPFTPAQVSRRLFPTFRWSGKGLIRRAVFVQHKAPNDSTTPRGSQRHHTEKGYEKDDDKKAI